MAKKSGLKAKAPKGIFWKPFQADGWGLFKSLSKAGVNLLTLDWEKAVDNALGAIECVKFKDEPGELAWAIVYRAMTRAVAALLRDPESRLTPEQIEKAKARSVQVDTTLAAADVVINEEFFEHPGRSPYARAVGEQLREWLKAGGVDEYRADDLAWQLPLYFTSELSREWLRNKQYVDKLLPANFRTPFTPAEEEEIAWAEYAGWLQDQADRRVFEEDFGLMSVYVPLRAYVETGGGGAPIVRTVGVAEQMLDEWVKKGRSSDDVRVIEGDPGAGKSSTARVYAATRFGKEIGGRRWRVVYVPLHRIDAELKLEAAVAKYGEEIRARLPRPLDKDAPDPTLLILDGLDELSKAGHVGQDVIQGFMSEVTGLRSAWNHDRDQARLLVLICGRPVAVDTIRSDVKSEQGYIYLLPYLVNQQEVGKRPHQTPVTVNDSDGLLGKDQREVWWAKYAAARKRSDGAALYERIKKRDDLTSITAQPLLNYLVAYLLQTGEGDALPDNLSQIYARLLRRVWERGWERGPQGQRLEFEPFCDLLEAIALAAWHSGDGRSVSLHRVEGTLTAAQREQLAQLEEQVSDGVLRLLLSFFFRPVGYETRENKQHRMYEFSHKSFAEYLVSRRLVRLLRELAEDWSQFGGKRHWDDEQALVRWQELFGPTQLDAAVDDFIQHEVRHVGGEVAAGWQKLVARLLGVVIERGMPMHRMVGALQPATYLEMNRQALNGEYALLRLLDACGAVAEAREVIPGLVPQLASVVDGRWRVLLKQHSMSFLHLQGADLSEADLSGANLSGANLSGASLSGASLSGANLSGARMYLAGLSGADLSGVYLSGADLSRADLSRADLTLADLSGASLSGVSLFMVSLYPANLTGANLSDAKYTEDQILATQGTPARLADGSVPAPNFREKLRKPRRTRKKKSAPAPPPPEPPAE